MHSLEIAERNARKLGMSRGQFLRTSCGMAVAFAVLNKVYGNYFTVEAAELFEPSATAENKTDYFIFDVQSHHVAASRQEPGLLDFRRMGRPWNPELTKRDPKMEDLLGHRLNLVGISSMAN